MESNSEKRVKASLSYDIAIIAVFVAIITVFSWISIPTTVPVTLQTLAVFLSCGLLGGKRATIVVAVYILFAIIGVPVLAGFSGGIGVVFGATGGYLIGFLFNTLSYWLFEKLFGLNVIKMIIYLTLGMLLTYLFGTLWFMWFYASNGQAMAFGVVLGYCVTPFILFDALKLGIAVILTNRLGRYIHK